MLLSRDSCLFSADADAAPARSGGGGGDSGGPISGDSESDVDAGGSGKASLAPGRRRSSGGLGTLGPAHGTEDKLLSPKYVFPLSSWTAQGAFKVLPGLLMPGIWPSPPSRTAHPAEPMHGAGGPSATNTPSIGNFAHNKARVAGLAALVSCCNLCAFWGHASSGGQAPCAPCLFQLHHVSSQSCWST